MVRRSKAKDRGSVFEENRKIAGTLVLVVIAALFLTYCSGWMFPLRDETPISEKHRG
jgi:hypothetical protein